MFCHNCGTNNPDGFQFCKKCGTKLVSVDSGQEQKMYVPQFGEEDLTVGYRPGVQNGAFPGNDSFAGTSPQSSSFVTGNINGSGQEYQNAGGSQAYQNYGSGQPDYGNGPMNGQRSNYGNRPDYGRNTLPAAKRSGFDSTMVVALFACVLLLVSIFIEGVHYPSVDKSLRLYDDMCGKLILLGVIPVVLLILLDIRVIAIIGSVLGMIDLVVLKNNVDSELDKYGFKTSDVLEWSAGYYVAWVALAILLIAGIRGMQKKRQEG